MIRFKKINVYIIDMLLVFIFFSLICHYSNIAMGSSVIDQINGVIMDYRFDDYTWWVAFSKIADILQASDKAGLLNNFIIGVSLIFVWIIIPFFLSGKTIGMKIMHLDTVFEKKPRLLSLTIRALLLSGLGFTLILMLALYILPSLLYTILTLILLIIQIGLIIYELFMVLYRSSGGGLVSKLSHTKIIEVKK